MKKIRLILVFVTIVAMLVVACGGNADSVLQTSAPTTLSPNEKGDIIIPFMIVYNSIGFDLTGIIKISPDGTKQELLSEWGKDPSWSPDRTQIAFAGDEGIFIMNADGSSQTQLIRTQSPVSSTAWSPDGSKIAFVVRPPGRIMLIDSDGGNPTQLAHGLSPAWSPDGSRVAFTNNVDGYNQIFIINVDGSGQKKLTDSVANENTPEWSPDGARIVFQSDRDRNHEIYLMNTDGSDSVRLTNDNHSDFRPDWSPDGSRILFASDRAGSYDLYFMEADGSNITRVTKNESMLPSSPDW